MPLTALFSGGRRASELRLAHVLRCVQFFRGMPAADLAAIWRRLYEVSVPAGKILFERGEPGDRLYIVKSGRLEIRLGLGPSGVLIRHALPGEIVGELALLTAAARSADVIASENTLLWALDRADFETLLAGSVSLMRAFVHALCERVAVTTELLEQSGALVGRGMAGMHVGAYRIMEQIGAGGMAIVYSAVHVEHDTAVALKLLPLWWATDSDMVARFDREAAALQALTHPHVVRVFEVGEAERLMPGMRYIAMEWLPHGLDRILQVHYPEPLAVTTALRIAEQICCGLAAVHDAGLVHRDVKPSNIMLRADGTAVLTDFGLVSAVSGRGAQPRLTASNVFMGTADYMSPEKISGGAVDGRSDIYALGVVLYEMLSGSAPFAGRDPLDVLRAHVEEAPPPLPPEVPSVVCSVVERALRKVPAERFASASDMARDLSSATAAL